MLSATIPLRSGARLPQVGAGTWKHSDQVAPTAIYNSIKEGFRLFDGACDYGNEKACGLGVKRALDEGIVKRSDLWIVSKLWQTFHAKEHVRDAVKRSLADWGVDYFDLYYIHFPISFEYVDPKVRYPPGWFYDGKSEIRHTDVPLQETWQALEALVDEGLIKHLGISNCTSVLLMDLMKYARVKPEVLQIEIHPYNVQSRAVQYAQSRGLAVTGYSSFGPAGFRELSMPKSLATPQLFTHPTLLPIATVHKCSTAQVILRWAIQRGIAIIPKADDLRLIRENLTVGSEECPFVLTEAEMATISGLDKGLRFNDPADDFAGCYIFS